MEKSQPFDPAVVALGRKLVKALSGDGGRDDVLGSWIAHYIAQLMDAVDKAGTQEQREAAASACMDAILKLWDHRHRLPNGSLPFDSARAALTCLTRIDPRSTDNFYFWLRGSVEGPEEYKNWLRLAEAIDGAARTLIRFCLDQAMSVDADKLRELIEVAPRLDPSKQQPDVELMRALLTGADTTDAVAADDTATNLLREKIELMVDLLQGFRASLDDESNDSSDSDATT